MPYAPPPGAPRRRRPVALIIILSLLFVALVGVIVYLAVYLSAVLGRLDEAIDRIDEQQEIIDSKETFASAMQELVDTAKQFDGLPYGTIVSSSTLESLAARGWDHRWDPDTVALDVQAVQDETSALRGILEAAAAEAAGNSSGSAAETAIDSLGRGFVATAWDDADALCESDVLGCVTGADPYVIHLDAADRSLEWMGDWQWTGIAYHEFAHVLQYTNPGPTETAAASFGGDWETMADCFALTYLDGWTLESRVWVSPTYYYDVNIGYGYTCNADQRQVIRDWYEAVGYETAPVSQ